MRFRPAGIPGPPPGLAESGPPAEGWLSAGGRPDDDPDGRRAVTAAPPRHSAEAAATGSAEPPPRLRSPGSSGMRAPRDHLRPPGRQVTVRCEPPPRRPAAIPVSSGSSLTQWLKSSIAVDDCATIKT